jgi:hypothetical protein
MKDIVSYEENECFDDDVYEEDFDFIDLVPLRRNEDPLSLNSN